MNKLKVETWEIIQKIRGVENQMNAIAIMKGIPLFEDVFFQNFTKNSESRMGIVSVSGESEPK